MITCTRVVKGEGLIFLDIYLIAKIINIPDKKYTTIFFNFSLKLVSLTKDVKRVVVTNNSASIVEIIAPYIPITGINNKLLIMLTTAPKITAILYTLILFIGTKYCLPTAIPKGIITISGATNGIVFKSNKNFSPKNHGTNFGVISHSPNIIGIVKKS